MEIMRHAWRHVGVWFCEMEVWRTVRTPEGLERRDYPSYKSTLPVRFQELLHGHEYSVCCKMNQCELCIVKWSGHEDMRVG